MWRFKSDTSPTEDSNKYKNVNNPRARNKLLDILSKRDLKDAFNRRIKYNNLQIQTR